MLFIQVEIVLFTPSLLSFLPAAAVMSRMLLSATKNKPFVIRQKITCCALVALSALCSNTASSFTSPVRPSYHQTTTTRMASSLGASFKTANLEIVRLPCLSDNYGWLLHDAATGSTAVVDTPEAKPYQEEMAKRGWKLTHIFNTHQ